MATTASPDNAAHAEPEPPPLMNADDIVRRAAATFRKLTPEQTTYALHSSVSRARVQVEQTRQACERGKAEHRANGSPKLVTPSPRQAELERLTAPPSPRAKLPEEHAKELRSLDTAIRDIREQLVNNPLWIAATHVERTTKFTKVDDLLRQDPELASAKSGFAKAESTLVSAKKALERWQAKPGWLRAVQNFILGSGEKVQSDFDQAAQQLVNEHQALTRLEAERRYHHESIAAERNAAAHEQQADARTLREQLESPLRAALLERSMAQDILTRGLDIKPLREAPANEVLEFTGIRDDRSFPVHEFRSPTTIYRADAATLAETNDLRGLVPGDKFHFGLTPDGTRALQLLERGPNLSLAQDVLEGRLGATHREGDKLLKFELTDASGNTRWVVPTMGDDLMKELRGDLNSSLVAGNLLRIQNREVHVLERGHSHGVEH